MPLSNINFTICKRGREAKHLCNPHERKIRNRGNSQQNTPTAQENYDTRQPMFLRCYAFQGIETASLRNFCKPNIKTPANQNVRVVQPTEDKWKQHRTMSKYSILPLGFIYLGKITPPTISEYIAGILIPNRENKKNHLTNKKDNRRTLLHPIHQGILQMSDNSMIIANIKEETNKVFFHKNPQQRKKWRYAKKCAIRLRQFIWPRSLNLLPFQQPGRAHIMIEK